MSSLKMSTTGRWLLAAAAVATAMALAWQIAELVLASGPATNLLPASSPSVALPAGNVERWRAIPVQFGRVKPLGIAAAEWVPQITGRERFAGVDPLALVIDWRMQHEDAAPGGTDWDQFPLILCDWPPLRERVLADAAAAGRKNGMPEHGRYLTPADLKSSPGFVEILRRAARQRTEEGARASLSMTTDEQQAEEVSRRLALFDALRGERLTLLAGGAIADDKFIDLPHSVPQPGETSSLPTGRAFESLHHRDPWRVLPALGNPLGYWFSLTELRRIGLGLEPPPESPSDPSVSERLLARAESTTSAWQQAQTAYRQRDAAKWEAAQEGFVRALAAAADLEGGLASPPSTYPYYPDALSVEIFLHAWRPFFWAWVLMLTAAVMLGGAMIGENALVYRGAIGVYSLSLVIQVIGLSLRTYVAGRAPVASMYETIVFAAVVAGILALVLECIYHSQVILLAAALVSSLGLILADQLPLALDPSIAPLVPVLRSNFWLMVHVLTIVGGYAAGMLAWGLGNVSLGILAWGRPASDQMKLLARFTYYILQVTVVLLAAGTLLGGCWAYKAWGRFWGWDPKEVAALVSLVVYILPLHARFIGWVNDLGLLIAGVVCFGAIVMSWYVVNFLLAAGLHSYGFSSGGAGWVLAAVLLNALWVLVCCFRLAGAKDADEGTEVEAALADEPSPSAAE